MRGGKKHLGAPGALALSSFVSSDSTHPPAPLLQVIDFGDTLEVSTSTSPLHDALTCTAPGVPLDASNLVLRAFDLFRRKTGLKQVRPSGCRASAPMPSSNHM